ncbi:unnamed protein product [Parnassius apollo]|uniref:Inositol hexakisphosphate and diphosphoinositol-pentakisphosphate kinase n=1 Tax=Parnassius apollo TaxID=110799 RepID=A0A8S3WYD8_PARAO|nr:unnamed protein product [Parnassius apollo]
MSYTELEHGYQGLRQATQPQFYVGDDGNLVPIRSPGELDLCEPIDPHCDGGGKKVVVGVCAMAKKSQSKPMKEILTRLDEFEYIKMLVFPEEVILKKPVEEWPICDCLISFHSKGFPLDKAIQYEKLRKPYVINNLHMQYDIQDRRRVYAILEGEGIEIPRYAVLDRDSPDPKHHELVESEDHVEVNGVVFNKPFVEKPVSAEDHNIYIYYPTSAGGGSQRLFRKIGSRSSIYSPESRVRKTGSFIYEDFMPTDGTDVKVYTVGPDYAHAEARKSPALDGKVERDSEGKEIRYPVILSNQEKLISRKVCLAFKQTVCGFDLLRANGKSFVCDVNGFSFVKNSNKYYDDCAKILGNMILRELAPTLHIPWSVPFQLDDPPIVPTTFGKMMELRCVVAVIRHGDRTPKQKMKVEVRHPSQMSQVKTRQKTSCPVFGLPEKLPVAQLPTYNDVMKNYLFIKYELKPDKKTKEPTIHDISERLAQEVLEIWRKASLPTVSLKRVLQLIRSYHDKYRSLMKPYRGRQLNKKYQEKINTFITESHRLFDVCSCKCKLISDCTCSKDSRVPKEEIKFLLDQRTTRKMMIGGVDLVTTVKNKRKLERQEKSLLRNKEIFDPNKPCCSRSLPHDDDLTIESTSSSNSVASSPYQSPKHVARLPKTPPPPKKKKLNLSSLALACDRTGVSDRAAAIIASSVLKDVGIISTKDPSGVIDRSKLRRERTKVRSSLQDADRNKIIRGIYFDGRKDKSLVNIKKEGKFYRKRVTEDHYVILSEPGSDYFGHVTCELGTAKGIQSTIIRHLKMKSVDLNKIAVVGCDGTVVNTGSKGGVVRLMEEELKKPLQWFICQLHSNELPLRHLLLHLDGKTTGPKCFSGPIGSELQKCETMPIVEFTVIPSTLPEIPRNDLSTDQKYLYDVMNAISTGVFTSDLANIEPGPLSHSRWLTTANRILRLYATKTDPLENLMILATYVMKVYGPMWFTIKCNPSCINGAKHLWQTISLTRYLSADLKIVIDKVLIRNGYFGHPENILIAMLGDDREIIRELACQQILKARAENDQGLRTFKVPPLNFDAEDYTDLIKFFEIFEKYEGFKRGHVKLKRPKQLQEILDISRALLADIHTRHADPEIEEKQGKLEQLKSVLEMYGHFSGINRKVQMKYQPRGRPRGSSSDDVGSVGEPSLVLILKGGGELTPAGRIQAEELGRMFRCMYPGGQGRHIPGESGTQGLGLLRLHSTFRHDLKIYASDEGRVQMTAAAFAKGLLALEGELTPILVQMVKSANTNGLLDNDCDSSKVQNMAKARLHEAMQVDREFTEEDRACINPCGSLSIAAAMDFVKNPVRCCAHVHCLIQRLVHIVQLKKDDHKTKDTILYHGETWELMGRRWGKIEKDFCTKNKTYDISKIPDIYDCIKYDLQHNQHTLQFDQAEELYIYAKYLADIVIPQEYGLTMKEKLTISQGICTPLLKKIRADLQRNIEECGEETVNRLNPRYSHGVSSPGRHVRTRLYFTSESHVHSLLTVLRCGGLLDVLKDEQWRRAMEYVSMVSELNYMSQIVVMLYEDPTKDPCSEERFHVELHFSPGVNCCVQKNLPPGPGFRPHSRNHSTTNNSVPRLVPPPPHHHVTVTPHGDVVQSSSDEVKCIEEEEGEDDQMASQETLQPDCLDDMDNAFSLKSMAKSKLMPSNPIPICNLHYTVTGHEASSLAARLTEELRARSHPPPDPRPHSQSEEKESKTSEEAQPLARSYDQHKQSHDNGRRQRHSIAGQMSYLKMLGLGARGKLTGAAGLFSTAVISGSSSAPNLRIMIPATAANNTALEGFGGVPAIRPLETLHNALSLRQLDAFLERVTAAPAPLGTPPHAPPPPPLPPVPLTPAAKRPSPTSSTGWSGPSSLMSSSGELTSGVSSTGPSSPTSAHADARSGDSNWSKNVPSKLPQWDGEAATLCAFDVSLHPFMPHTNVAGSYISGDVTPVSAASELEFNSNEATAGSGTDRELLSAEGEDDEDTLSTDACSSMRIIKNDLTPHSSGTAMKLYSCQPLTSSTSTELYGLNLQQTKENLYKDMPSSSKNYNHETGVKNKCFKGERSLQWSNLETMNLQSKEKDKNIIKINDILNNGSRRYSDSSAQKSNRNSHALVPASRFTTTLVDEDQLRASTSSENCEHRADSTEAFLV